MRLIIEIHDDWLAEAEMAIGPDGTNDDEHELLLEAVDAVKLGRQILP